MHQPESRHNPERRHLLGFGAAALALGQFAAPRSAFAQASPAIALEGDADGVVPASDGKAYAARFAGAAIEVDGY